MEMSNTKEGCNKCGNTKTESRNGSGLRMSRMLDNDPFVWADFARLK